MASQAVAGPPYLPKVWQLGGDFTVRIDIPVTAVYLLLYIIAAACHMTILQLNQRKGHKFFFSGILFGFCASRIVTCIMRISSIALPTNGSIAIAAQIFTAAGVVLLFIINLFFAERIVRATHPRIGWNFVIGTTIKFLIAVIIITIIMVITAVVQTHYTLDQDIIRIDRAILLYGTTTFAVISFLPFVLVLPAIAIPRQNERPLDRFGEGKWRSKVAILLITTTLTCFGASYRAGTTWCTPVPRTQPVPGVLSRAPFYTVNFTVEILVVYLYFLARVDKRFHVPDNAKRHRNYAKAAEANNLEKGISGTGGDGNDTASEVPAEHGQEKTIPADTSLHNSNSLRPLRSTSDTDVANEKETFGDASVEKSS